MAKILAHLFRFCVVGATALALFFQISTAYSCELVKLQNNNDITSGFFFYGYNGQCQTDRFDTDDFLVRGARTALIISIVAGFLGGIVVLVEWIAGYYLGCCCVGVLQEFWYCLAWAAGGSAFMFYASDFCRTEDDPTQNNLCQYNEASTYLTISVVLYVVCSIVLCCAPQPEPLYNPPGK